MADVMSAGSNRVVFWSNMDLESSEDSDAIVPGVNAPGNRRPTRIHARKTREVRAKIPLKQPVVENLSPRSAQTHTQPEATHATGTNSKHVRRPSLKDLCLEDKTRIASLIKELARVGDEREVAVGQLHHERQRFETQVLQLVSQQEQILKEREDVQNKLFECQNLLTKYQDELLNKQEKLKASINHIKDEGTQYSVREERGDKPEKRLYEKGPQFSDEELGLNSAFTKIPQQHLVVKCDSPSQHQKFTKPVTSMIDRQIALEKSGESSGRSGDNSPRTPPLHRKERTPIKNMQRKRDFVPSRFREPIMSSTQKSSDINSFIPHDANSDIVRISERCESPLSSVRDHSPRISEQDPRHSVRSEVIFRERIDMDSDDDNAKKHSPNLPKGLHTVNGDEDFVKYYRKLTPNERKQELLRQREALLDEQKHLRQILLDQEEQLKLKQQQLEQKHKQQKERLQHFEQKIVMSPALNPNAVVAGECMGMLSPCEALQSPKSQMHVYDEDVESSIAREINVGSPRVQSRLSVATSPVPNSPVNKVVSMATSPISSPNGLVNIASPRRVDVATSISYRSPRSPLINRMDRQGNLPFLSNRQKSSPATPASATPGEKTLSVVEIVNSLDDEISPLDGSYLDDHISPGLVRTTPNKLLLPSPHRQKASFNKVHDGDDNDELEESQILEDVFFLK